MSGLTAFYERLLGKSPASSSDSHASFDLEGTTLFIHVLGESDHEGAPNADHLAFALAGCCRGARAISRCGRRRGRRTTPGAALRTSMTPTVVPWSFR